MNERFYGGSIRIEQLTDLDLSVWLDRPPPLQAITRGEDVLEDARSRSSGVGDSS